jgi:hypothetical protein
MPLHARWRGRGGKYVGTTSATYDAFFSTLCPVINTCRKKSHDLSVKQPSQRKN